MSENEPEEVKEIHELIQIQDSNMARLQGASDRLTRLREQLLGESEKVCEGPDANPVPPDPGPRLNHVTRDISQQITVIEGLLESLERYA